MPSPFPGMDPWLEAPGLFPDLHQTLIAQFREAVNVALPRPYYTALGTRLYVEGENRRIEPDVDILVPKRRPTRLLVAAGGLAVLEPKACPLVIRVPSDPVRECTLEIRHPSSGDRLVTSVEILSPSNKSRGSEGRRQYLKKRNELKKGRVNIVEIDLLRGGEPSTLAPLGRAERLSGPFDYHVCVRRYYRSLAREVYPIPLAERLPYIAIPLLKGDADVTADLQVAFDRSYDVARFDQRAAYGKPAVPLLTAEQQVWAEGLLQAKGVH